MKTLRYMMTLGAMAVAWAAPGSTPQVSPEADREMAYAGTYADPRRDSAGILELRLRLTQTGSCRGELTIDGAPRSVDGTINGSRLRLSYRIGGETGSLVATWTTDRTYLSGNFSRTTGSDHAEAWATLSAR